MISPRAVGSDRNRFRFATWHRKSASPERPGSCRFAGSDIALLQGPENALQVAPKQKWGRTLGCSHDVIVRFVSHSTRVGDLLWRVLLVSETPAFLDLET